VAELVSIREFARRDGCNEKLVRRGLTEGRLPRGEGGKIDAALAGTAWRVGNMKAADTVRTDAPQVSAAVRTATRKLRTERVAAATGAGETPEQAAMRLAMSGGLPSHAVSLATKEHFLALQRELEYDKLSGAVVLVEEVAGIVGKQLAAVRTRLLAIPTEHAPRIARMQTANEVQDALRVLITAALSELAEHAGT